jgi:hypothetical protein
MGETVTTQTQNVNMSGGLQLGTVSFLHIVDQKSAVRAAFFILLIWFGFKIALEIIKYLISK